MIRLNKFKSKMKGMVLIMKSNRGITLIALTITVIVILIIAAVSLFSGTQALKDAKKDAKIAELNMLKQMLVENYTKYLTTKDEEYISGTRITNIAEVQNIVEEINSKSVEQVNLKIQKYEDNGDITQYYYKLNATELKKLGVELTDYKETINEEFIVNYKSGEVMNITQQITGDGTPLYTYAIDPNT